MQDPSPSVQGPTHTLQCQERRPVQTFPLQVLTSGGWLLLSEAKLPHQVSVWFKYPHQYQYALQFQQS